MPEIRFHAQGGPTCGVTRVNAGHILLLRGRRSRLKQIVAAAPEEVENRM